MVIDVLLLTATADIRLFNRGVIEVCDVKYLCCSRLEVGNYSMTWKLMFAVVKKFSEMIYFPYICAENCENILERNLDVKFTGMVCILNCRCSFWIQCWTRDCLCAAFYTSPTYLILCCKFSLIFFCTRPAYLVNVTRRLRSEKNSISIERFDLSKCGLIVKNYCAIGIKYINNILFMIRFQVLNAQKLKKLKNIKILK